MGTLIVVDCEAPFGVGAPSVGDMTEFGAVDVNALQDGRVETFHGTDCSEDTFRQFLEWLTPRMPVVFVWTTRRTTSNGSISTSGAISAKIRSGIPGAAKAAPGVPFMEKPIPISKRAVQEDTARERIKARLLQSP